MRVRLPPSAPSSKTRKVPLPWGPRAFPLLNWSGSMVEWRNINKLSLMRGKFAFLSFLFGAISIISGVISFIYGSARGMGDLFKIIEFLPILSFPGLLFGQLGLKSDRVSLARIGRILCVFGLAFGLSIVLAIL